MALFERMPVSAAKAALDAAAATRDQAANLVKRRTEEKAAADRRHENALAAKAEIDAQLKDTDAADIEAASQGRPLPDTTQLRAKHDLAERLVRVTEQAAANAAEALQLAQDELDDATEAHARATRADLLTRLAAALALAVKIDAKLKAEGSLYFKIEELAAIVSTPQPI